MEKEQLITKIIQHLKEGLANLNSDDWATAILTYQFPPANYVHLIINSHYTNAAGEKVIIRSFGGREVSAPLTNLFYELNRNQECNTFIVRAVNQGEVKLEWDYSWDQAFVDEFELDEVLAAGLKPGQAKPIKSPILPWYKDPAFERKLPGNPSGPQINQT